VSARSLLVMLVCEGVQILAIVQPSLVSSAACRRVSRASWWLCSLCSRVVIAAWLSRQRYSVVGVLVVLVSSWRPLALA
jgi:hypothetical protein